jgi:hypothetical protein
MEAADTSAAAPSAEVRDEELLYRAVRKRHFTRHTETDLAVTENAFTDPEMKPSVDRAHMRDLKPQRSRFDDVSNGVCGLVAGEVRAIDDVYEFTASGQPTGDPYVYDVIWRPIKDDPKWPDNPAHSQVETERVMNGGAFKRLRRKLAFLGSQRIELEPLELIVYLSSTRKVYHTETCHHVRKQKTCVPFKKVPADATACTQCKPQGRATV